MPQSLPINSAALSARADAPVLIVSPPNYESATTLFPGFVVITYAGADPLDTAWSALAGRRVTVWEDHAHDDAAVWSPIYALTHAARPAEIRTLNSRTALDLTADSATPAEAVAWARQTVKPWENPWVKPKPAPEPAQAPARGKRHLSVIDGNAVRDLPPDPAAEIPPEYSDDRNAQKFTARYRDDLRYVSEWGSWLRWEGNRWRRDTTLAAFDLARGVLREIGAAAERDFNLTPTKQAATALAVTSARSVANVERLAKADRIHAATTGQWDADPWLLNTPAGVLDLRAGTVRAGRRDAYMTKITNAAPEGDCPVWREFLLQATDGDLALIGFLQRMAGACLTGITRDHALFFFYGPGGNGKGTYLNTLAHILGDYAVTASMETFTETRNERHTQELASLMGARLVTAQETEEGRRWAEARIKALTGGDPITARFMRQNDFTFQPQLKLAISGNHKPGLRSVDEAIRRRMHLIPFTRIIPAAKRDLTLSTRLRAEGNGILQWAVEGCFEWQRQGLAAPESVRMATDDYLESEDSVGAWIKENCDTGAGLRHRTGLLYKNYAQWCTASNEFSLPRKRWEQALESRKIVRGTSLDGQIMTDGITLKIRNDPSFGRETSDF